MDILDDNIKNKIDDYIEQKESKTSLWQIEDNLEELGLDVQITHWLKNDEQMLKYAKLYLKRDKNMMESIRLQFLELKTSITCPYFADFKIFLDELQEKEDKSENKDNLDVDSNILKWNTSWWVDVSEIKSLPFYKNTGTGVTWCSATARLNWSNFGLQLPRGNAFDAWAKTLDTTIRTIPEEKKNERPRSFWQWQSIDSFNIGEDVNFADIYLSSSSKYGHRAVAFRDLSWDWYVLDPYTKVNWILDDRPKKMSDYMKVRKVVKANFYKSKRYEFESKNYV